MRSAEETWHAVRITIFPSSSVLSGFQDSEYTKDNDVLVLQGHAHGIKCKKTREQIPTYKTVNNGKKVLLCIVHRYISAWRGRESVMLKHTEW